VVRIADLLTCGVWHGRYALAADIQTIPGLPTAPGYLNVDVDVETGEIQGLF
jgi:methylenetetrahydrofolate dehydrogenase (NADP+)/methenyltetrahydrofolate cyclohydrolase/formyltetrahydrofolate synthetase